MSYTPPALSSSEKKGKAVVRNCRQIKFIKFYNRLFEQGHIKLARFLWIINRLIFACDIFPSVKIGENMQLMHFGLGVVIHPYTVIGDNVFIYQQVTIGVKHHGEYFHLEIGDNVFIGAGAKILGKGDMTIGKNVIIGANCVVLNSIPDNAVVVGNPARIVKLDNKKVNIKL